MEVKEEKAQEGDGVQRTYNGYVRQGWILLISPTGYIVSPARRTYRSVSPYA